MEETNVSQNRNSNAENHHTTVTVDRTARIFATGSQSEIIAELERLEQDNVEFNKIEGIDDLFIHHDRSVGDLLDEMVAEFGLEYPDFDIFNYVDPALNVALDDGAADVLNIIDCEIRQPDVNLDSAALSDHIEENSNRNIRCELDVQKKLVAEHGEELQSLKSQLQKQQELISELQKQLNCLEAIHHQTSNLSQEDEHQQEVELVSTVNVRTLISTRVPSENVDAGILTAIHLDSVGQPNAQKLDNIDTERCEENSICMDEEEHDVVAQQSEKMPYKRITRSDEISEQSNTSSLKENQVRSPRKSRSYDVRKVESLRRNILNVRKHSKTYSCKVCNYRCTSNYKLTRHLRIHTGEKPFKCRICDKSFSDKSHLARHLLIHTGERPYQCRICDMSFNWNCQLTRHLRIHTGEKPHKCQICDTSFRHKNTLAKHLRIHTGEKPYECQICDTSFSDKSSLTRHLRIHTGEKPFECDICKKSFRQKTTLSFHMNIHSGRKPYECNVCKKTFRQQSSLRKHLQRRHV